MSARWNAELIQQLKEYANLLADFEVWNSPDGRSTVRPLAEPETAASEQTENAAILDGPYFVAGQQSWPEAKTFGASARVSNQLVQDAFNTPDVTGSPGFTGLGNDAGMFGSINPQSAPLVKPPASPALDKLVGSWLAESLGRAIAPVASSALNAAAGSQAVSAGSGGYFALSAATPVTLTSGASTELASGTIALDTAAEVIAQLDAAYLPRAKWHFSTAAWEGIVRQVDGSKRFQNVVTGGARPSLHGYPVVISSGVTAAAASTVSGPVFGDMSKGMTLRVVDERPMLFRSTERYAEYLQTFYRSALRADVALRDLRAIVAVQYAAS